MTSLPPPAASYRALAGPARRLGWPAGLPAGAAAWLREAGLWLCGSSQSRLAQLERLRELDARMLRDVGLTRAQALRAKPWRDAP